MAVEEICFMRARTISQSDVSSLPSRCVVGDDWWYYGDSCQYKGSVMDYTTLALASSLSVLGVMLVITAASVICVKKKYKRRGKENNVVMSNICAIEKT